MRALKLRSMTPREGQEPMLSGIFPVRFDSEMTSFSREGKEEKLREVRETSRAMEFILISVTRKEVLEQVMKDQLQGVGSSGFQSERAAGGDAEGDE